MKKGFFVDFAMKFDEPFTVPMWRDLRSGNDDAWRTCGWLKLFAMFSAQIQWSDVTARVIYFEVDDSVTMMYQPEHR